MVAAVTAEDEKTVSVTLNSPNSDFLAYVTSVYIVPDDYTEQATAPVGTGPFRYGFPQRAGKRRSGKVQRLLGRGCQGRSRDIEDL